MVPSTVALDSGSLVSQETLVAIQHDSRDRKHDESSEFATTELRDANGVGCPSFV